MRVSLLPLSGNNDVTLSCFPLGLHVCIASFSAEQIDVVAFVEHIPIALGHQQNLQRVRSRWNQKEAPKLQEEYQVTHLIELGETYETL